MKKLIYIFLFLYGPCMAQCEMKTETDKMGIDPPYNWTSHKITKFGEAATFKFIWVAGDTAPMLNFIYFIAYSAVITVGPGDNLNIVFDDKSIMSLPIKSISQGKINHDYYSRTSNTIFSKTFQLSNYQLEKLRNENIYGFRIDAMSYRMEWTCKKRQSDKIKTAAICINKL